MEAYDIVKNSRNADRWCASDYIKLLITDFLELHGDRKYGDDKAVIAGIGKLLDRPITVIGIEKGNDIVSRLEHNFGSAHPEGYRKAMRLMKEAEKFGRPVLCLIDTAGAYAGVDAEERGQGQAIAESLMLMSSLRTPVISIIIGEGGSGGALALAVSDRLYMLDDAYFSVVSPENCATILWKSNKYADKATDALKLTAVDLKEREIIDDVFKTASSAWDEKTINIYKEKLLTKLDKEYESLAKMPALDLVDMRYKKYRRIGRV